MKTQLLLFAKAPVPGRVKTRLCPPYTPPEAARLAAAALADTVATLSQVRAVRHTLVLSGRIRTPPGWWVVRQRGDGLGARLANGYANSALPGVAAFLVGMDTPQLRPADVDAALAALDRADAVLGPAEDGGWWGLGLRDPHRAAVLRDVVMSTSDTAASTVAALCGLGLRVATVATLRDVDTAADVLAAAAACPNSRFARVVGQVMAGEPVEARS